MSKQKIMTKDNHRQRKHSGNDDNVKTTAAWIMSRLFYFLTHVDLIPCLLLGTVGSKPAPGRGEGGVSSTERHLGFY